MKTLENVSRETIIENLPALFFPIFNENSLLVIQSKECKKTNVGLFFYNSEPNIIKMKVSATYTELIKENCIITLFDTGGISISVK
jgi:hypothetical protein